MTGNNKVWRAPLAGLAAVAMLATMGVAASTANAATLGDDVKVTVAGATVATPKYGESLKQALNGASLTGGAGYGWVDKNSKPVDFSAPLTGDVELKQATVALPAVTASVRFTSNPSAAAYYPGGTTLTTVDASENIPQDFLPSYPGYAVTAWKVTPTTNSVQGDEYTLPAADVEKDGLELHGSTGTSYAIQAQVVKTTPVKFTTATNRWKDADANVKGLTESDATLNDGWFDADVAKDGVTVDAPEFVYNQNPATSNNKVYTQWTNGKQTIKAGEPIPADADTTGVYVPDTSSATVTYRYTVTFNTNGGSNVDTQYVNKGETVKKPADPTRDGYVFQGWKSGDGSLDTADGFYAFDSEVKGNLTLKAEWAKVADIKVTFSAGSFAGAGDDKSITVAGDAFVDESQAPKFTREGYTYDSWFLDSNVNGKQDGSETAFDFTTTLAGKANGGKNFTLVPVWERADANKAKNALKYVQPDGDWVKELDVNYGTHQERDADGRLLYLDRSDPNNPKKVTYNTGLPVYVTDYNANSRSDKNFFTESSFDGFAKVYKAQYQKYVSAAYKNGSENTNEVDAKTSAEIVSALQDAWKGLRFRSDRADTVLDGKTDVNGGTNTAVVVRRLAKGSAQHLLTADENEVKSLTSKLDNASGWTLDATTFRTVDNINADEAASLRHPEWVANEKANTDLGFAPLLKQVSRLYNGREHLYTSDAVEIGALLERGWSKDSNLASFYVPAQYTTGTHIVRLYNPASGTHLYTSDQVEIGHLLARGWTQDSDNAGFYAL